MRVLMIAPEPFFEPRGTPFSILNRLASLTRHQVEVDLVTYPIGFDPELEGVTIHRSWRVPGIRSVPIGFSLRKLMLDAFLLLKARRMLRREQYDLVHTHEEAGLVGHWLVGGRDVRHLYDMHSNLFEQMRKSFLFRCGPLRWIGERLQRGAVQKAAAVITICPELQAYVERVAPDVPSVLIENIFDAFAERGATADADELRTRLKLDGKQVLLYTGTFEPYQGLDLLVGAAPRLAERFPDARFVLVGGTPAQVRQFDARAVSMGVRDRFVLTGTVPAQDIPAFIDLADILLSSRREGSNTPSKIYTYLRSGKPLVATNLETHTQVLNDKIAVLTENTPDGFAEGIAELLSAPECAREIGRRAKAFAAERYDVSLYHDNLRRLYRSLGCGSDGRQTAAAD